MGKARTDPLHQVKFYCRLCGHKFEAEPERIEDSPDEAWHPWRYFAACGQCGEEAEQAYWERNLLKAWARATGPQTDEGKAATAANLEGHPTPEEAKRTRFNAMTHGIYARTATYFPAKPGRYPHCKTCEYFNNGCDENPPPGQKNPPACMKRAELFMRHQVAFETKDPGLLLSIRADVQAALQAIVDDMILAITASGVELRSPEWYFNPQTGEAGIVEYTDWVTGEQRTVYKVTAHPLIKPLVELIQKNNLTLADMGMTPKVQEEQDLVRGTLEQRESDRQAAEEYRSRQQELLENLGQQIQRSQARVERDPVLIEHQQNEGG